jgi:hypothetical protein
MTSLCAVSTGPRVKPHRIDGTVHGVFADACNIDSAAGEIFTLLSSRKPDQPGGIRLASPPGFAFSDHLSAGDRVSCRSGLLRVHDRAFIVDLRHAEAWCARLPSAGKDLDPSIPASNWMTAADAFRSMSRESTGSGSDPFARVWDFADGLTRALSEKDWEAARGAVRSLIGCGPGLTPWGDDFVVGFLAGYECLSDDRAGRQDLSQLRGLCDERIGTTSDISRSILRDALAGRYGMPVYALCEAIFSAVPSPDVVGRVRDLMEIGDSSGEATCYGILSGIAAASSSQTLTFPYSPTAP